ncbi:MAG TPA: hypothetical protein VHD59_02950 [Pseudolabrys sp.]|jgi:hypothetical protein|nr:hypothetical protein [Pseudolabrys sp.]
MGDTKIYRNYCHVCWLGGRCWRIATAGLFEKATNWGSILGLAVVALALQWTGRGLMLADSWQSAIAQTALFIVAAWFVLLFLRLVFYAPFVMYREGTWHGNRFVFREPKLAFHAFVSTADNNSTYAFRFPDAPPFSFINYKIEPDGPRHYISVAVMAHEKQLPVMATEHDCRYTNGGIAVNKDRDLCMRTFLRPDATPFSVRIYVTGWENPPPSGPPQVPPNDKAPPAYWGP